MQVILKLNGIRLDYDIETLGDMIIKVPGTKLANDKSGEIIYTPPEEVNGFIEQKFE